MGFVVLTDTQQVFSLNALNTSIFVGRGATQYWNFEDSTLPLITSSIAGTTVRIEGTVLGTRATAILLAVTDQTVIIGPTGSSYSNPNWVDLVVNGTNNLIQNFGFISGGGGIQGTGWGSGRIENDGTIAAQRYAGIKLIDGIGNNTIINDGLITGTGGIVLQNAVATIRNGTEGEIRSNSAAVAAIDGTLAATGFVIRNLGTIAGPDDAVLGSAFGDTVRNDGVIDGDVLLGGGNDVFRGRKGLIEGELRGGDGNDTLITGRGDDALFGDRGADRLDGGAGDDTMTGGQGSDVFVFSRAGAGGADLVADFQDNVDDLDLVAFRLASFAAVQDLARDVAGGLVLDLGSVGGGTVLLAGMSKALLDAGDVLI